MVGLFILKQQKIHYTVSNLTPLSSASTSYLLQLSCWWFCYDIQYHTVWNILPHISQRVKWMMQWQQVASCCSHLTWEANKPGGCLDLEQTKAVTSRKTRWICKELMALTRDWRWAIFCHFASSTPRATCLENLSTFDLTSSVFWGTCQQFQRLWCSYYFSLQQALSCCEASFWNGLQMMLVAYCCWE